MNWFALQMESMRISVNKEDARQRDDKKPMEKDASREKIKDRLVWTPIKKKDKKGFGGIAKEKKTKIYTGEIFNVYKK